jgi:antitoxin component of MazEF toxin-antitoxin module
MKKHLTRIGNSLGIVLDRPLLEKMQVDPEKDVFEVSSDGSVIIITPVRQKRRQAKLKAVADRVFDEYAGVFKLLAE